MIKRFFGIIFFVLVLQASYIIGEDRVNCTEFSFVLKPSALGGVGVFATHDIAKGTLIIDIPFELRVMNTVDIPDEFKTFSIAINDEQSACPQRFDRMEIGWYINHCSQNPNIEKNLDAQYDNVLDLLKALTFYAIKDIPAGDEILIDVHRVQQSFGSL